MRTRLQLLHEWHQQLAELLPQVRKTHVAVLAVFALGVMLSGSVTLLRVAHSLPLGVVDASTERRLRRWLSNPAVSVQALWAPLAAALLAHRIGGQALLTLDPTPRSRPGGIHVLGLVTHKRVLPLAWHVLADRRELNEPEVVFLSGMFHAVAERLPEGCEVTLVADRGLTGPDLIRLCQSVGWHYVLRVSADARQGPKLRDGRWLWELVGGPGQKWYGSAQLWRRVGWMSVQLSIYWGEGYSEPWILISDRQAGYERVRQYRRRWQAEATYQDCKGRGWGLGGSRIVEPARLERLLLALFVALWWTHALGLRTIKAGWRRLFDRPGRRDLSVVRLGRCLLQHLLEQDKLPPLPLKHLSVTRVTL